ncbi:protein MAIN-LIKE 1-like [Dioscorea cayenensis subsp. rotundata]|uniref:Protein MAIN-LIKE 1-like n=1 Tax=Dioscorea cayennensis subsp. rotundata TaxID=55577 RepID=A0AB40B856_DIOCR|nr:protein MAIN-LIKE 1-like [Dioscorea cayenensis subsp. rotundata]
MADEKHMFHLTCDETTITLEDVELLLGLPISGHEVIRQTSNLGSVVCAELLEVVPSADQRKGQSITLTWLEETFSILPYDVGQREIECYAHAYILRLISSVLMLDMSQNSVHLKWLPLLRDFTEAGRYSRGSVFLATLWAHIEVDDDSHNNKHNVKPPANRRCCTVLVAVFTVDAAGVIERLR